ncbi:hypothetical protein RJ640_027422 [Escallonia rubra]|uniref:Exostosin GT47 domain-containing protein n=1 Tax=Escallonia rubra TaxID=112253 RepID=A0AA88UE75_9ASTE|nr:hypothetical protein RJ640_027422 [Escallonia rubra]
MCSRVLPEVDIDDSTLQPLFIWFSAIRGKSFLHNPDILFKPPHENYMSLLLPASKDIMLLPVGITTFSNTSKATDSLNARGLVNGIDASKLNEKAGYKSESERKKYDFTLDDDSDMDHASAVEQDENSDVFKIERGLVLDKNFPLRDVRSINYSSTPGKLKKFRVDSLEKVKASDKSSIRVDDYRISVDSPQQKYGNQSDPGPKPPVSSRTSVSGMENIGADSRISVSSITAEMSTLSNDMETQHKDIGETVSLTSSNYSTLDGTSIARKRGEKPPLMSDMASLLLQTPVSTYSVRPRWSSARDREIQHARLQIENAPISKNTPGLHASAFRNVTMFKRSYELMESMLRVFVYREGEKPIFHQPNLIGVYASEGWFMKLIEGNKRFMTRDPKKAHLFYLPFSSEKLRRALHQPHFLTHMDLEEHLKNYINIIAKWYPYWNRTNGADHFLVACHDWGPEFTRNSTGNCIRALCNSNVASGFILGKDVSLPTTAVRTTQNPAKDLGGKPPSKRHILAFFAGGMHGYLRPILLQYWSNKEPDMKISGPMARDVEGQSRYREYMKSSKYCICARGFQVHTPRLVESISYECVPVIISDNYVPPFFELLDWEAFSVFIPEEDIPNLRNILLSIPEEKYLRMQHGVKMVRKHFIWNKKPVKYDLFHMILHSIWYNRVFENIEVSKKSKQPDSSNV